MELLKRGSIGSKVKQVQRFLNVKADGIFGPLTEKAVKEFQKLSDIGVDGIIGPITWEKIVKEKTYNNQPKKTWYEKMCDKYGNPSPSGNNLVFVTVPFPLIIAWDKKQSTNRIRCHKLVADQLKSIFEEIAKEYSEDEIYNLGLNMYGGCFNYRNVRGGSRMSVHAWGIGVDMDPERNRMRTKWKDSQFSKPEYKKFIYIWYKHGFMNYGVERNFDAMHFEPKKLF